MLFELYDENEVEVVQTFLNRARMEDKIIALTSGTFDLIHFHHITYLTNCRRRCDILIVGVDSDALVRERKGPNRPAIYDFRRAMMVDSLKPVSFTFIMQDINCFRKAARLLIPNIIFKSDAFAGREDDIFGREFAKQIILVSDLKDHMSTTEIIEDVTKRKIENS